jgi:hypothetical protein
MIRVLIFVMLLCMTGPSGSAEAQMIRKAGSFLWKKLGIEATEASAKKAGKQVVAKSTKSAAWHAGKTATGKASTASAKAATRSANLVKHYGDDAAKLAGNASVSAKSLRRMSMIADDVPAAQRQQLMTVVAGHSEPNRVIEFLYKHRGELFTGGLLVAFLAQPDEVMGAASDGVSKIMEATINATGKSMVTPIAEEAAKPLGHWLGFTCFVATIIALGGWIARIRWATRVSEVLEA